MKQFLLILVCFCNSLVLFAQTEGECTQTVTGEVRDQVSTDVLAGAEVVLTDANGAVVETQTLKEDGVFSFTINCETTYTIAGKKEEYTAESKTFTTTNEENRILQLIILLDKGNIDFVTDGEANAKTIDSIAKAEIVAPLPDKPILDEPDVVIKEVVAPVLEEEVQAEVVEEIEETVVEEESKPEIVKEKTLVKIDPIYFDYESSWLNEKTRNELQKIVNMMKENPKMVIECEGHTDAKGDDKYNQWMSDRRAKRAIDYIVSKGISASRISGKGYGETQLVNECTNEVECSDEERAANRRTEFVIVKM